MRCKRHPYWVGPGVCAGCLREQLLILVAAQDAAAGVVAGRTSWSSTHPLPLPVEFPRSVSPYTGRRSTETRLFFSTPQVGPRATAVNGGGGGGKHGRFSALAGIFRSKSDAGVDPPVTTASSWFSNLLRGKRRKKKSRLFSMEDDAAENGGGYFGGAAHRGMSPARKGREEHPDESPAASGYYTESPAAGYSWKSTGTPQRRRQATTGLSATGLAFCLSPLVRACPARDVSGFSGEIRPSGRPHLSTVGSLGGSRSRKLADFGKFRIYDQTVR